MSLTRQLWLAITLVTIVAFGGSAMIGSLSARNYLQEQLLLKNIDNAGSLASTLSQMPKDEVTIDLLISAQFDTGHYEYIGLLDPHGEVIADRTSEADVDGAPAWFERLFPIEVEPGIGQVLDGWSQYGTVIVRSHARYAYRELWAGTIRLLGWFALAAFLTGVGGSVLLRLILKPLGRVVEQAEAVGQRRFVTIPEPMTREFRAVVRSMNALSDRVRRMLEEESARLDKLLSASHRDPVSGLFNRDHFMSRLRALLEREDGPVSGALVIGRLPDLQAMNRRYGWRSMDTLIARFGAELALLVPANSEALAGRLNGSEFALLVPGIDDVAALGKGMQDVLQAAAVAMDMGEAAAMPVGATIYHGSDAISHLLARTDAALANAVQQGNSVEVILGTAELAIMLTAVDELGLWRERFASSLTLDRLKLVDFPVTTAAGQLIHRECVARLRVEENGEWLTARDFMPWLARLDGINRLDELVIDLAIETLRSSDQNLCINLSAQSLEQEALNRLATKLRAAPSEARRLALEVTEHGVFSHLARFRQLCETLKPLGCRIGMEHMGHQISRIGRLYDLGLDYVKVDGSFSRNIETGAANQVFLRGLVMMFHAIGVEVIAESVETEAALAQLIQLGFDGATGRAVTARLE